MNQTYFKRIIKRAFGKSARAYNLALACILSLFCLSASYAIQGDSFVHDPSSIVKDGNTYWMFFTGDGVSSKYSPDLVTWTAGPSPYTKTSWPSWINNYVTAFSGSFWAPECIYMNGLYYLYYSCAGNGQQCIGLATSPSLNNPIWTDRGMVVYANSTHNYFAIDPDVFFDASGKLWLSFGSWKSGIKMTELNKATGKPLTSTLFSPSTIGDAENSQVIQNGGYYYMFINRGLCCKDANSTYYIQVGRSTSVTGPYTGWRTVLSTSGNFIGPGGIGYFNEGGVEYASFHYYDGGNPGWKGAPTLAIGRFSWSGGWPTINLNWLSNGTYSITNVNSGLVWDDWGCTGSSTESIAQGTWYNLLCQKWDFTHLGNGYYKITCALGSLSADVSGCKPDGGTPIGLYTYWGGSCQAWRIERTSTGSYVISTENGNRVVEVPNASSSPGQPLALWDYNGNNCQKWNINTTSKTARLAVNNSQATEAVQVLPHPVADKQFKITLGSLAYADEVSVKIFDLQGKVVFKQSYTNSSEIEIDSNLTAGVYVLTLQNSKETITKKLLVQ